MLQQKIMGRFSDVAILIHGSHEQNFAGGRTNVRSYEMVLSSLVMSVRNPFVTFSVYGTSYIRHFFF